MGLTYDGITYRSLEEQVRYDAEQVQLLKQADVTINEKINNIGKGSTNIENGTGTGSLVQKRLKSDGVTWTTAKAYQGASTALGGGTQAGRTETEFNNYFWDSTTNEPINGGQGKDSNGKILDKNGLTYDKSYSFSVAEGENTKALGRGAHSEGRITTASGTGSHAEGGQTIASAENAHAEGGNTKALYPNSHAEGHRTITSKNDQHVCGRWNKENPEAMMIVGNGSSETNRKNAFEVLFDGRAKVQSAPKDNDDVVRKGDLAGIGGGGNLYRHEISVKVDANSDLYFCFTDNVQNYSKFTDIPIKKGVGYYASNTDSSCPAVFDIGVSDNMLSIYFITMNRTNPSAGVQWNDVYKDFSLITYTDTAIQL